MRGSVVKIFADKGHGFVRVPDEAQDRFFHRSSLVDAALSSLHVGALVDFDPDPGDGRGPRCSQIRIVRGP